MTVTTPALAAAFRLAVSRPVRRHEWRPPPEPVRIKGEHPSRKDGLARREQVRRLLAEKLSQRQIAARLHVSRTTIFNHVRAIKAEERNG